MATIFLSSSYTDLQEPRRAVIEVLRKAGHKVLAMEDYDPPDRKPLLRCLEDVRRSDIYLGIFAFRYGTVPFGYDKSFTELELLEAERQHIPRLIFFPHLDYSQEVPTESDSTLRYSLEQTERIKDRLKTEVIVSYYHTIDDLRSKTLVAVHHHVAGRETLGRGGDPDRTNP